MGFTVPEDVRNSLIRLCRNYCKGRVADYELKDKFILELQFCNWDGYTPIPEGTIVSDMKYGHFPGEIIVGFNIWKDNGGLFREDFKFGDTITLIDHYGLKSEIKVTGKKLNKKCEYPYDVFEGIGTVEGYTSSKPVKMEIDTKYDQINSLDFFRQDGGLAGYCDFPLWHDQIENERKNREAFEKDVDEYIAELMREIKE